MNILFVCLGNICRSPMAEAIFQKILERENLSPRFLIDSAGLISAHEGEMSDSRMRSHALKRGYVIEHRSRPILGVDFERFDLIVGMDDQNMNGLKRLSMFSDAQSKIYKITDFCQNLHVSEVPDPYYGGEKGFEQVIDILEDACEGLFKKIDVERGSLIHDDKAHPLK